MKCVRKWWEKRKFRSKWPKNGRRKFFPGKIELFFKFTWKNRNLSEICLDKCEYFLPRSTDPQSAKPDWLRRHNSAASGDLIKLILITHASKNRRVGSSQTENAVHGGSKWLYSAHEKTDVVPKVQVHKRYSRSLEVLAREFNSRV